MLMHISSVEVEIKMVEIGAVLNSGEGRNSADACSFFSLEVVAVVGMLFFFLKEEIIWDRWS